AARRGRARQGPRPRWPDITMLDRLAEIERHYEELERLVSDPAVLADRRRYVALAKERAQLEETVTCWRGRRRTPGRNAPHPEALPGEGEEARGVAQKQPPAPATP